MGSNVIVPMAASRMTEGLIPEEMFAKLSPEHIAPIVAWLCHEDCQDSGKVIEALAGWAGAYRWQRSRGVNLLGNNSSVDIETVRQILGGSLQVAEIQGSQPTRQQQLSRHRDCQADLGGDPRYGERRLPRESPAGHHGCHDEAESRVSK